MQKPPNPWDSDFIDMRYEMVQAFQPAVNQLGRARATG